MRLEVFYMAVENVKSPGVLVDPGGRVTNIYHLQHEADNQSYLMQNMVDQHEKPLPNPGVVTVVLLIQEEES